MDISPEETHLSKWGNSQATRIPKKIIDILGLKDNQKLTVKVQGDSIILTPVKDHPTNIHELFAGWKDDGIRDHELDWGRSKGKELPW